MIWYGCSFCQHLDRKSLSKCAFLTGELEYLPLPIISGERYHLKPWEGQATDLAFKLASEFREIEIAISNADRFEGATFLEQSEFEDIGIAGDDRLIIVGYEFPDRGVNRRFVQPGAINSYVLRKLPIFTLD